jgi:hypothetical protein
MHQVTGYVNMDDRPEKHQRPENASSSPLRLDPAVTTSSEVLERLRRERGKLNKRPAATEIEVIGTRGDKILLAIPATKTYEVITKDLQKKPVDDIKESDSSYVDTNSQMQETEHQPPDTTTELIAIQQRAAGLAYVAQTVAELGIENADIQVQIAGLHEIATRYEELARKIGKRAVADGKMSQIQLSRTLGVAPMTVNRWVKAAQEQQNSQEQQNQ